MTDPNGHTWSVDEDGECEYDQGYVCPCGARKVTMANGDTHRDARGLMTCSRVDDPANDWGGMGGPNYVDLGA